jgi:hypothetical protein
MWFSLNSRAPTAGNACSYGVNSTESIRKMAFCVKSLRGAECAAAPAQNDHEGLKQSPRSAGVSRRASPVYTLTIQSDEA